MTRALVGLLSRREPAGTVDSLRLVLAPVTLLQLAELVPVLGELSRGEVIRTPYFAATPSLSASSVTAFTGLWAAAALASLLAWRPGVSLPLLALLHLGALVYDRQLYSNHFFLLTLLLLLLAAAEITTEGEGRMAGSSPSEKGRTIAGWPVVLMRTQLTSVYLFAGLSKLNPDFLAGRVLAHYLEESLLPLRSLWSRPGSLTAMAAAIIAVELFLAIGLWIPGLRGLAVGTGLLFHVSILVALGPSTGLIIFAIESVALYPLFLPGPGDSSIGPGPI